ncbi:primosomal protein N' [Collinsella tanakaei]|nr:primosomal protein N' [Collinsella tanakaei]
MMDGRTESLFAADGAAPDAYASVVVDIPARALSDPFAYAVAPALAGDIAVGCTVLVAFGHRPAIGYVVALADSIDELPGAEGLAGKRIRAIDAVLTEPVCSAYAGAVAYWMSREYVAPLAECLRLFLPPGGTPRLRHAADGSYELEPPAVPEVRERVVSLTPAAADYLPPARAVRQRQLMEALACGPVTTRELNLLYTDLSAAIRALEKRGVVEVRERRAWRGIDDQTTLSSARSSAPAALTAGQSAALGEIERAVDDGADDVILVDGVTGSGKTEVYLAAIEHVLAAGRTAIVLVPEISLTAQTVGRFRSRFGGAVAVFHSRLSAGERLDQWDMVRTGAARVVVGARSALFCPLSDLGLIVIDEEHEQSYKQGSSPRYHAREVAAQMAHLGGFPLVLGSATPSAEALHRCRVGEYLGQRWCRMEMPERAGAGRLPDVIVADLRREFAGGARSIFSRPLREALLEVAERREKAVLLHNRRGFAPFLMCRDCGCVPTCKHCSTALTYHERTHTLECHTCGATYRVQPYPAPGSACPKCGSRYLAKMGMGTQQVEDALIELMPPEAKVIRMDADSTRGKDAHKRLLEEFDAAESAVLLGTQMIAKGLDFPEVTLVGVVIADYALKMPDFRASERAFDLLEQVAGRAGRGERAGKVIIQTYLPDDPVIRAVAAHDRAIFTSHDDAERAEALYPPYVRLTNVVARGRDDARVRAYIGAVARAVMDEADVLGAGAGTGEEPVRLLGPTSCVIERAKDQYRHHFIIKSAPGLDISGALFRAVERVGAKPGVKLSVDVDAYDLM